MAQWLAAKIYQLVAKSAAIESAKAWRRISASGWRRNVAALSILGGGNRRRKAENLRNREKVMSSGVNSQWQSGKA
jgi:hypothetical protein